MLFYANILFICIYNGLYIYRFPKNETLKKKWIINMKRLEKYSKTKLCVPGPPQKFVYHISKCFGIYYFLCALLFFVSYLSRNYLTQ